MQNIATKDTLLNDISTAGTTYVEIDTSGADDIYIILAGSNTPNWVVTVQTSDLRADFTSAASATNVWTNQYCINTSTNAGVDGATGVTINTTTPVRLRVNDFYNNKIGLKAVRTSGNLSAWVVRVVRG